MKSLYLSAVHLTDKIASMKKATEALQSINPNHKININDDGELNGAYIYAFVRCGSYLSFLHGEIKQLQKELTAIESEIKSKIN